MRTTVTIAPDVYAEIERLRREDGLGPSEALNQLARRGLSQKQNPKPPSLPRPQNLGVRIDISNIGSVLEMLDEE